VQCPSGDIVTGGGYMTDESLDVLTDMAYTQSAGIFFNGWVLDAYNANLTPAHVSVVAYCLET
jgi:hypothetical protein